MAFMRDDDALSLAVLAICDALEERDETKARDSINRARKQAQAVLSRGRKKRKDEQPETAEGANE